MRTFTFTLFAAALPALMTASAATQKDNVAPRAAGLLSEKCLKCHDSMKRSGGIDLTTKATASLILGTLSSSRLLRAVSTGKMPPSGKLPAEEIELLKQWISAGAKYPSAKLEAETPMSPTLWSFQPIRRPALPRIENRKSKIENPIDLFIQQKLLEKGLTVSPPADKLTLIRRVTVDLTGLPPTSREIEAFFRDRSPKAYERVVDRLLASSAYGERWGRHWLDVVRFGESNGYEQNHLRQNAWPYRDYVIRSFNEDKPYDRFVVEQIAGDVLAKDDPGANAGTGFLVAGIHDTVGIQEEEGTRQQRINDLEDIVSTTGAAFLGLTIGCARCHDHKFDPIPQRDFYRIAAVFAGVKHGERPLDPKATPEDLHREAEPLRRDLARITTALNEMDADARLVVLRSRGKTGVRPPVSARWNLDAFEPVTAKVVRFTTLATTDRTEPCIDELQIFADEKLTQNLALASAGGKATASSLLPGVAIHQVEHLNDGRFGNERSWISNERGGGWAQIELREPATISRIVWSRDGGEIPRFDDRIPQKYKIEVSLDGTIWKTVSTDEGRAGTSDYVHPDELMKAMSPAARERRESLVQERGRLNRELVAQGARRSAYLGTFAKPDATYVLRRGDVMQREEQVLPGGLCKIGSLKSDLVESDSAPETERRLALAGWITDPKYPLTARVMVNRIWQHHFGRGLVGTPSDFGRNGERPTHPELLDWLADDFMRHGWKMKRLHKLMVMSNTYRQDSRARPAAMAKDASNLYLWRMPLQRMEAEAVRDAILQASGKLDRRMGGPGYQLYEYNVVNVAIFQPKEDVGPETWRRGIYSQAARGIRDSLMGTLDCPESSQRAPKRESTTTALQALSLLNGSFMQQQAGYFAERVEKEAGSDQKKQASTAFELALGRPPSKTEAAGAIVLVREYGLTSLCRTLMNSNEFLYY
jgi:hypothetical protein